MAIDFTICGDTVGFGLASVAAFQESGAFPTFGPFSGVPGAAQLNSFSGFIGPFQSGNIRLVLAQSNAGTYPITIQAWIGPAAGPLVLTNAGSQPSILQDTNMPNNWSISACQDPSNPDVVYVVYWKSTGVAGSSVVSVQSINIATGLWGAEVTSALTANTNGSGSGTAMVALFRNSDRTIQVFTYQTFDLVHTVRHCGFAAFATGSSTWSGAWTPCGDLNNAHDCIAVCGAVDSNGNCYVVYQSTPGGLIIQSLSTSNVLSSLNTISAGGSVLTSMGQLAINQSNLSFVWADGTAVVQLATAVTPGTLWTVTSIIPAITNAGAAGISPDGSTVFAVDATSGTIYQSVSPFAASSIVGNLTFFSSPALFVGGVIAAPATAISAQVAFQGVRRFKGNPPEIGYQGCVNPHSFTYVQSVSIDVAVNADGSPNGPITIDQPVSDYDFDLFQVIITYSSAVAVIPPTQVIATVQLYDYVRQVTSNIPMLDIFMNGAPGSPYENGAIVPPLRYPKNSRIRFDFYSLVSDSSLLPVTAKVQFVGMERRPG